VQGIAALRGLHERATRSPPALHAQPHTDAVDPKVLRDYLLEFAEAYDPLSLERERRMDQVPFSGFVSSIKRGEDFGEIETEKGQRFETDIHGLSAPQPEQEAQHE
jgi:hypothetical protein